MRKLVSASLAVPAIILSLCLPAAAQQLFFFGNGYWNDDYVYGRPNNPNNPNFDPAAAAINALNVSFPRNNHYSSPVDFSLIDAMERGGKVARGGKFARGGHVARCQARYVTYSPATDLYIANGGQPRRCKL